MNAKGDLLLFLNNDIKAFEKGWFEELVSKLLRPGIGCVGAKLSYPNDTIKRWRSLGIGAVAGHYHKHSSNSDLGYKGHLIVSRNTTAVTAACLMIRKGTFRCIGGFDEGNLKVSFNDVDLCLRIIRSGLKITFAPKLTYCIWNLHPEDQLIF